MTMTDGNILPSCFIPWDEYGCSSARWWLSNPLNLKTDAFQRIRFLNDFTWLIFCHLLMLGSLLHKSGPASSALIIRSMAVGNGCTENFWCNCVPEKSQTISCAFVSHCMASYWRASGALFFEIHGGTQRKPIRAPCHGLPGLHCCSTPLYRPRVNISKLSVKKGFVFF